MSDQNDSTPDATPDAESQGVELQNAELQNAEPQGAEPQGADLPGESLNVGTSPTPGTAYPRAYLSPEAIQAPPAGQTAPATGAAPAFPPTTGPAAAPMSVSTAAPAGAPTGGQLPPVLPPNDPPQAPFSGDAFTRASKTPKNRKGLSPVVALLVGALVGGAAGAGVGVWGYSSVQGEQTATSTTGTSNIVINNTDSVTQTTAAVAKASPSVVTVNVTSSSESGTGSGVILDADGNILTNNHVVTLDGAASNATISVTLSDGRVYAASIVGLDAINDLAVIAIDGATDLTPITWGDSSEVNVGDTAIAIGAPLGLTNSVTDGIVSALNRGITVASSEVPEDSGQDQSQQGGGNLWDFDFGQEQGGSSASTGQIYLSVIQTDASINPGNSGGALINSDGELIGINVAIASASSSSSDSSGSIGVGFSIPSNVAKRIATELIENGSATHGLLGASIQDDSSTGYTGVKVVSVVSGGAAEDAGLKAGDVITAIDGIGVQDSTQVTALIRTYAPGDTAALTVIRDGSQLTIDATLGALSE